MPEDADDAKFEEEEPAYACNSKEEMYRSDVENYQAPQCTEELTKGDEVLTQADTDVQS